MAALFLAPITSSAHPIKDCASSTLIPCPAQLTGCLKAIQKLPEAKNLIMAIQREGSIKIAFSNERLSEQFGAFWDPDRRTICVSKTFHGGDGELIGSILFELHNASAASQFDRLDKLASCGKIDRESYVKAVEQLEYQNSIKASKLAYKGIQAGFFPPSAKLPTYRNFEEHYHYQKIGGHSAWIGRNFDCLSPRR